MICGEASVISPNQTVADADVDQAKLEPPFRVMLARYGRVPQVARFGLTENDFEQNSSELERGTHLVVKSDRGPEIATLLEVVREGLTNEDLQVTGPFLRIATDDDLRSHDANQRQADVEFFDWQQKLDEWQLQLQLIDVERTLDEEQVILYVLNGQNAETTRLALLAAAAGLGIIHVQPVAAEGIVRENPGGGCGAGGCGSGGCGS